VLKDVVSASGRALAHPEFAYAINQLPAGDVCATPIARVVPPPPARATKDEGWLRLTYGDALDVWSVKDGWKLVDAGLDPRDTTRFEVREGNTALVNTASEARPFVSAPEFGDGTIRVGVMLASGANATIYVAGRYGIRISDSPSAKSGALVGPEGAPDRAPLAEFKVVPGNWHQVLVDFRAPRFDEHGVRRERARLVEVRIDGVLVQENVELDGPSRGAWGEEMPAGPLLLVGSPLNVAFADVRVKPAAIARGEGWKSLLEDDGLAGWDSADGARWKREDGVLSSAAKRVRIVSSRADLENFRVHAKVKLGNGSAALLRIRARSGVDAASGIAVVLNADHRSPWRTGSMSTAADPLMDDAPRAPRRVGLVGADTWFDLDVDVRDSADRRFVHVNVLLNGVLVNSAEFARSEGLGGAIALENHHDGSVIEVSTLEVLDLSARASDRSPPPPR
jgi:hypothetical protein